MSNVVNNVTDAAKNADAIAVEDAIDLIASVAAVAFLVVEYIFHDNFPKMEKIDTATKT